MSEKWIERSKEADGSIGLKQINSVNAAWCWFKLNLAATLLPHNAWISFDPLAPVYTSYIDFFAQVPVLLLESQLHQCIASSLSVKAFFVKVCSWDWSVSMLCSHACLGWHAINRLLARPWYSEEGHAKVEGAGWRLIHCLHMLERLELYLRWQLCPHRDSHSISVASNRCPYRVKPCFLVTELLDQLQYCLRRQELLIFKFCNDCSFLGSRFWMHANVIKPMHFIMFMRNSCSMLKIRFNCSETAGGQAGTVGQRLPQRCWTQRRA